MSENEIPKEVKDFVFHAIDSAEQLDILLLLQGSPGSLMSAKDISDVLRSSPGSIEKRIEGLARHDLVVSSGEGPIKKFGFNSGTETASVVSRLAEIYKSHRYGILEIIFSPLKKSRDFAEAFKLSPSKDPKGGRNG